MSRCLWCHKLFTNKRRKKYCDKWCKNKHTSLIENRYNKKNKKKSIRAIRTYYWSKTEGKSIHLRSLLERHFIEYLDFNNVKWRYEPKYFKLSNGTRYLPDFYILNKETNEWSWIEVKGRFTKKFNQKFALFKKDYPNENIDILNASQVMKMWNQVKNK